MGCIGEDLACSEYDVSICAKDGSGPYDYDLTSNSLNLQVHISYNTLLIFILITAVMFQPLYVVVKILKGALIGPGVAASHGMERTHLQAVENTLKLLLAYIA